MKHLNSVSIKPAAAHFFTALSCPQIAQLKQSSSAVGSGAVGRHNLHARRD
jgi:hypothetical protein